MFGAEMLGGMLSGGVSSAFDTATQYFFNNALQKDAQDYNTWASSTTHTREVKDLRRAGLNPILSGLGGSGSPALPSPSASVGRGDSLAAARQLAELSNVKAQTRITNLNADKLEPEAALARGAMKAGRGIIKVGPPGAFSKQRQWPINQFLGDKLNSAYQAVRPMFVKDRPLPDSNSARTINVQDSDLLPAGSTWY